MSESPSRPSAQLTRLARARRRAPAISAPAPWRSLRRAFKNSIFSLCLLVLFHVVLCFEFTIPGARLPSLLQRLVAFADAAVVAVVLSLSVEDWRRRFRPGAEELAAESAGAAKFGLAGVVGFILTLSLWLSPWAPIKIASDRDSAAPANADAASGAAR